MEHPPTPHPTPGPRPFSSLSIIHAPDLHTVSACFHSNAAPAGAAVGGPAAVCYRYAGRRTPILAISQGVLHAQLSTVDAQRVSEEDLAVARTLARAAAAYRDELARLTNAPDAETTPL